MPERSNNVVALQDTCEHLAEQNAALLERVEERERNEH